MHERGYRVSVDPSDIPFLDDYMVECFQFPKTHDPAVPVIASKHKCSDLKNKIPPAVLTKLSQLSAQPDIDERASGANEEEFESDPQLESEPDSPSAAVSSSMFNSASGVPTSQIPQAVTRFREQAVTFLPKRNTWPSNVLVRHHRLRNVFIFHLTSEFYVVPTALLLGR